MDRLEGVRALLRRHGLRYSRPREAIMEIFREGSSHVSAESLHLSLGQRGEEMSLSTVYLNLNVLRDAGLVQEFRGVGGESLYDNNVIPHYHLICRESGEVVDVPAIEIDGVPLGRFLKDRIERETGWTIDEPRFDLRGVSPLVPSHADDER
ncbi:MAG: Fur family transcriptional regulator [Trueperaceae bacterium]